MITLQKKTLTGLTPKHICARPKPGSVSPTSSVMVLCVLSESI